jgi:hypothetical protein
MCVCATGEAWEQACGGVGARRDGRTPFENPWRERRVRARRCARAWKTKRKGPGVTGPTSTLSSTWSYWSSSALPTYVIFHSKSAHTERV